MYTYYMLYKKLYKVWYGMVTRGILLWILGPSESHGMCTLDYIGIFTLSLWSSMTIEVTRCLEV